MKDEKRLAFCSSSILPFQIFDFYILHSSLPSSFILHPSSFPPMSLPESASPPALEVLIVEDSPTQALRLQNTLENNGYRVRCARNGLVALEALAKGLPAIIVSDVQMPEMDGYELCQRVKSDPALKDIPLILLTSLSAPHDIIVGLESGADNFVVKPYDEPFLLSRIRTALANRVLAKTTPPGAPIPIYFAGEQFVIASDRWQILNLLLSTYETAVKTNQDLIKAQDDLKAAQAQLIEAEKFQAIARLSAGVAHEVRNPLAIMEMGLTFLADQPDAEANRAVLDEMQEAVRCANVVIVGLMDLSTPGELGMTAQSLPAIIERALAVLAGEIARSNVNVVREFADDLPAALADVSKLEQAFINIFTNALQAMPNGGALTLRAFVRTLDENDALYDPGDRAGVRFRAGERAIIFEVSDTGASIAPENLSKLFEPFFSTKPTGQGMGLGLTVAKKIIEMHRGKIEVRNAETGGATVKMTFKIA
jgi:signal transduction histidine kinase